MGWTYHDIPLLYHLASLRALSAPTHDTRATLMFLFASPHTRQTLGLIKRLLYLRATLGMGDISARYCPLPVRLITSEGVRVGTRG